MHMPLLDWDFLLPLPGGGGGTPVLYGQVTDQSPQDSPSGSSFPAFSVETFSAGSTGAPGSPPIVVTILGLNDTDMIPVGTWVFGISSFVDVDNNIFYEATLPIWL